MHRDDGPIIEHNPDEKPQPWWLWWVVWAFVAALWLFQTRHGYDWNNVLLGFITGGMLVAWSIDIAGVETPSSWRRKPRRRR